jgi:hypothetical protein
MSLIFVDVEAYGGAPSVGRMTEFGAVEYTTRETFHGVIWKSTPDPNNPAIPLPTELAVDDPADRIPPIRCLVETLQSTLRLCFR